MVTVEKKKKAIRSKIAAVVLLLLFVWILWGNTALELNSYPIKSSDLPNVFHGYRIAHVSDLHNAEMGKENETLLEMIRTASPDLICITGDMVDSNRTDIAIAVEFAKEAVTIAPCYFVTGNHEARISRQTYAALEEQLIRVGVSVLHDEEVILEKDGERISLIGIDDPDFAAYTVDGIAVSESLEGLGSLTADVSFTILLSHRPELFQTYVSADVDLVLSGHAHGGQFRLPLIGGLVAPNQGLFPKYDAGLYQEADTNMIVSRGIGNSIIPIRFNNRPEVILVELLAE
ncbi:MAG: metallophosphoesterase [Lachnospiraceae bacterium]|nr:metallophosphoesterase [Lachnospiraceae bacterium]